MTEGFCFHNDDQPVHLVPVAVRAHQKCVKTRLSGQLLCAHLSFFKVFFAALALLVSQMGTEAGGYILAQLYCVFKAAIT